MVCWISMTRLKPTETPHLTTVPRLFSDLEFSPVGQCVIVCVIVSSVRSFPKFCHTVSQTAIVFFLSIPSEISQEAPNAEEEVQGL